MTNFDVRLGRKYFNLKYDNDGIIEAHSNFRLVRSVIEMLLRITIYLRLGLLKIRYNEYDKITGGQFLSLNEQCYYIKIRCSKGGREYNNGETKWKICYRLPGRVLWRRIWQRHAIIGARQIHT